MINVKERAGCQRSGNKGAEKQAGKAGKNEAE